MSQHLPIQVVNKNDEPVSGQSLVAVHEQGLIHRVIHVIVEDEQGNILLQRRAAGSTTIYPDCWDISVGGHVDESEDYLQAATRELQEELGLSDQQLVKLDHYYYELTINNRLLKRFATDYTIHIPRHTAIHYAADEISAIQWSSVADIKQLIARHPDKVANGLVDSMKRYYEQ